ncbi:hypothetical protein [Streptomyces fulvoviolaceus]|uniref:hypothetical protein n=1 Tax=Streptomyces fulvoviolaceus TaxID=285535 RepID=UPI0021C18EB5|nr:hypothetical protein [Streptomyces fulvoviolaceus]MCT9084114.1 hypothetical protein [Streptomyces fulvoviolaceus]
MAEPAQSADSASIPVGYGWCAWHQNYARGVRLIRVFEQGSGSGGSLFACPGCRDVYDLVPLADQACTPTS